MPNSNDGDLQPGQAVEEEFVFDGKQMTNSTGGETAQEAKSAESPSDDGKTSEPEIKHPDGRSPDKSQEPDNKPEVSAREMQLHHQALDLVSSVLDWEDKEKAKKYFAEHPELASVANKSKKYKETYRSLIENPIPEREEGVQTSHNEDDTIDEDELTNRIMARATEQGMKAERKAQAEVYAGKNGINIDDFDKLFESAEALRKVSDLSFEKCLEGAKTALKGSLSKDTIRTPDGKPGSDTQKGTPDREAEIKRLMKEHNVNRSNAEKFLGNQKEAEAGGWQELM